jgi:hypothetical protein
MESRWIWFRTMPNIGLSYYRCRTSNFVTTALVNCKKCGTGFICRFRGRLYWGSQSFPPPPPDNCWGITLKQTTAAFVCNLPNQSLTFTSLALNHLKRNMLRVRCKDIILLCKRIEARWTLDVTGTSACAGEWENKLHDPALSPTDRCRRKPGRKAERKTIRRGKVKCKRKVSLRSAKHHNGQAYGATYF